MSVQNLSPLYESLKQWRRVALQLAQQLMTRKPLSSYEEGLIAEAELLDEEWAPQPEPPPPPDDRWSEW